MELAFPATAVGGGQEQVVYKEIWVLISNSKYVKYRKLQQVTSFYYELGQRQRFSPTADLLSQQATDLQSVRLLITAASKQLMRTVS